MLNQQISIKFNQTEKFTLFPEDEEEFIQYFINQKKIKDEKFKNDDLFEKRSAGLVSYFAGTGKENYPRINPTVFEDMKMSSTQFLEYTEIRKREKDFEKGPKGKSKRVLSRKSKSSQMSVSSTMRQYFRQYCDFVFPKEIPRPFKKSLSNK